MYASLPIFQAKYKEMSDVLGLVDNNVTDLAYKHDNYTNTRSVYV